MRAFLGFRSKTNLLILDDQLEYFAVVLNRVNDGFSDKLTFEQEDSFLIIKESSLLFREHLSNVRDKHLSDEWRQDAWLIKTEIGDLVNMININLDVLVKETRNQSNEYAEGLSSNTGNTIVVVVTLLIIAIAAIVIMIWLLTTQIIKPMTTAVDNGIVRINDVMAIMSGDADNNIKLESSDDEIERVEKTLAIMTDTLAEIAEQQVTSTSQLKEKIQLINDVVSQAANGDLTGQLINFDGEEGIDQLASGIQSMIDSLNKLVSQVQQSGIQVTSSTTEIAATAKEQEATVTEQAAATNQIMATATQISATTRELASTMHEVADVAEKTTDSANDGQEALVNMENTMMQMNNATASITSKLAVLSEKAANINTVVTTITKVADQTNLLSLNAAIEAEKAGEYGLGFAVVATEIRRLADQTAVATWDIEQMVKEMQSAVSAGVMGMDKFSEEVTRGVDEVRDIGGKLAHIIEQVQTLTPRFEAVNEGMQSQSHGAQQISDGMVQLNDATQQTVESLRQSTLSIDTLKNAASALQNGVSLFTVKMR
ncbi:MAG: methyl-accepting chemotaxis protein [Sulfuriflexus sp.]|nr:methyl-accepting chemotaxis protein [Sulfuriflexus sp.]